MIKQTAFILIATTTILAWSCDKDDSSTPVKTGPTGVTTSAASNISSDGASLLGLVGATGGSDIISLGFVYSKTNTTPTVDDQTQLAAGTALGSFTASINGLDKNTKYYFRSFALNSVNVSYGSIQNFTTTAGASASIETMLTSRWMLTGYKENDVDKYSDFPSCYTDDIWEMKAGGTLSITSGATKCPSPNTEPDSFESHWSLASDDVINLFGQNHVNLMLTATTMSFDYTGPDGIKVSRVFTKQ